MNFIAYAGHFEKSVVSHDRGGEGGPSKYDKRVCRGKGGPKLKNWHDIVF